MAVQVLFIVNFLVALCSSSRFLCYDMCVGYPHYACFLHQVDDKKTVGREAFARIAPVCAAVADIITVHNLFDALTSSSGHRLHFLVYDKYIRSLDKYDFAS
jgi:hypothetical protein